MKFVPILIVITFIVTVAVLSIHNDKVVKKKGGDTEYIWEKLKKMKTIAQIDINGVVSTPSPTELNGETKQIFSQAPSENPDDWDSDDWKLYY